MGREIFDHWKQFCRLGLVLRKSIALLAQCLDVGNDVTLLVERQGMAGTLDVGWQLVVGERQGGTPICPTP